MNCLEFNELIFNYIEGELDDSQKKLFEEHMKNCSICEKEIKAYQKMINDIHALPMDTLPNGYCKRLHDKLEIAQIGKKIKKRNNFVKYIGIAASCVLVFSAIYFTSRNFNGYNLSKSMDDSSNNQMYSSSTNKDTGSAMPEDSKTTERGADNNASTFVANVSMISKEQGIENKIIKSGSLTIQTLNFDDFMNNLNQVVRENEGYFEYNETSINHKTEDRKYKRANIKLRIPQKSFYDVVEYIEKHSEVYNRFVNETDVTKEYYDIQNILTNLQIQEDKLRELYDKTANITEILALENEIRRVRTEIDAYSLNLRDIDDRVDMATIELDIVETEGKNINISTSDGLFGKAKQGFIRTINNIIECIESIIVWIISYLPILVPIAIIGFVIYRLIMKKRR